MKKFSILIVAVALMAMSACNEKPAKGTQETKAQTETAQEADTQSKVIDKTVEKAKPTEDGKDHVIAEFETKEYQVRLENLADGTIRLSLWKPGADKNAKPEQLVETKRCVMQKEMYLMQDKNGNTYVIKTTPGNEEVTIMDKKKINHHSTNEAH